MSSHCDRAGVKVWGEWAQWQSSAGSSAEQETISFLLRSAKTKRKVTNPFLLPSLINETFYPKSSNMKDAGFWEHN